VDAYNVPLSASPDWWKGLPVHDLCVLVGEYEMFFDDIQVFAQNLNVRATRVSVSQSANWLPSAYHTPAIHPPLRSMLAACALGPYIH